MNLLPYWTLFSADLICRKFTNFGELSPPKIKSAEIREPYFTTKKFYIEKNNSYSNWSTMNRSQ